MIDENIREYEGSKARRNMATGQLLPYIGSGADPVLMAKRKHELAIEAAATGMLKAVEAMSPDFVPGSGELGAWSIVVGKQTELALSPDAGHASTKAAEFIGRAADLLPDRRAVASLPDGVAMQLNLTDDAAAMLADAFSRRGSTLQGGQGQDGERTKQHTDGGG